MTLSESLKLSLIERFAPILYLHRSELDFPVSAVDYVESSALWCSTPPVHAKSAWGLPDGAARRPLIGHRGISLNPAQDVRGTGDPDGDGIAEHYLGERGPGGFPFLNPDTLDLWLDFAGWHDGPNVTPKSGNGRTTLAPRPTLRQPHYLAEVWTVDEWRDQIGPEQVASRFGIAPDQHPSQLADLAVVSYYFLFPLHVQPRPTTALAPADDHETGNYEGDWTSFAVVVQISNDAHRKHPSRAGFEPKYAAFGHRWRGARRDLEEHTLGKMRLRAWSSLFTVEDHAVVQAARGTHNLYPHDPPANPNGTIKPQEELGNSLGGTGDKFTQDAVQQPGSAAVAAVTALKILAGWAIAGPLGAIVGAVAAAAEAASAGEEGIVEVPEPELHDGPPDGELEEDESEETGLSESSRVAVPSGIRNLPFVDPAQAEIRVWSNTALEALGELNAPLLLPDNPQSLRFEGRWGVRCVDDAEHRRSGIRFPDYRHQIVDALLATEDVH